MLIHAHPCDQRDAIHIHNPGQSRRPSGGVVRGVGPLSARQFDFFYMNSCNKDKKSALSERGQITIPKKIREQLGLRPGQELEFETRDGLLIDRKRMARDPVSAVTAILNPLDVDRALEESRGPKGSPKLDADRG